MSPSDDTHENSIVIHRLIVHRVDHRNYDQPILADLDTTVSDEVGSFIREHIRRNRSHKNVSTARYKIDVEEGADTVRDLGDAILQDESLFITNTHRVAELLFKAQKKKSTSPGELVLCLFSDSAKDNERWLALMKMDPEDGFVGKEEIVGDQMRITLERVDNVLPTGELQKCAFIIPLATRAEAECDLVVLDQQLQNYGGNRQVASFFLDDFLHAERDLNSRDLTRGFLRHVGRWADIRFLAGEWTSEQVDQLNQAAIDAVQVQQRVDITAFANQHFDNVAEEEDFIDELRTTLSKVGRITDLVFAPDPDLRKRLTRFQTYKGDYGLRVRVQVGEHVPDDLINHDIDRATNTHVITIRTSEWIKA